MNADAISTRTVLSAVLVTLSMVPWLGCDESDSISLLVDRYADALEDQSAAFYRCRAQRHSGVIDLDERRCMVDVYMQDGASARAHLECMIPLEQELTRCLDEQFECSHDFAEIEACVRPYYDGRSDCTELSQAMVREIEACLA